MPALGAGMDVGRIVTWHVKPGDEVHRGDIVALVETDKANIDVEVFEDGVIEELLVEEGTKVPVGTPLASIVTDRKAAPAAPPGDAVPAQAPAPEASAADEPGDSAQAPTAPAVAEPGDSAQAPPPSPNGEVDEHPFVTSPLVRHQAEQAGVDLTRLHGTGPGGLITRHDVEAAAAALRSGSPQDVDAAGKPAAETEAIASVPAARETGPRATSTSAVRESGSGATSASPYARRLAAERGLELATVTGSGPGGAVVARDVTEAPPEPSDVTEAPPGPSDVTEAPPAPPADRGEDKRAARAAKQREQEERALAMRQAIARAMERANREIPHYHLGETVDVEQTLAWLAERNADRPPAERVLPAALVLKATALALVEYRDFNGYWVDDAFQPGEGIHLGVAINLRRGGLLAPAIRDADRLTLDELMAALRDLVARTRSAGLRGSELTDPSITVSNLGDTGVELIHGVITPPQVALVGVGRITERPWAVDGMLAVRRTLFLSLAGDHRASDGHRGGRFLGAIAANLLRPETL
jgi:pyruvate dehydrogenase E2 component (dihydrolipoamide acetyltransferase)